MSKIENSGQTLKYKSLIIVVSIVIPLVVLILFNIRITSLPPLTFLPPIYATINGITAILLIAALYSIKNKKIKNEKPKYFIMLENNSFELIIAEIPKTTNKV